MIFKKSLILTIVIVSWFSCSCNFGLASLGNTENVELYPIRQNGKFGYMNRKGEVVIEPQFHLVLAFSDGLAVACVGSGNLSNGSCGYIDETGKFVISPQFDMATSFSGGLAAVITNMKVGSMGYIDKTGKFVINPQFSTDQLIPKGCLFSEGLAKVKINGKVGFIDELGNTAVNPQFEEALPFYEGLAAVKVGKKWGYIDKTGRLVINPQFEEALSFLNNLASVQRSGKYGYINKDGEFVINPQFDWAMPFSDEGVASVMSASKVGFIDRKGEFIINPQFEPYSLTALDIIAFLDVEKMQFSMSEGLTPVIIGKDEKKYGYIDKTGKIVINPQFTSAFPFYNGLAPVELFPDKNMAWIDKEGQIIWQEKRDNGIRQTSKNSRKIEINGADFDSPTTTNTSTNVMANASNMSYTNKMREYPLANAVNSSSRNSNQRTGRFVTDSNIRSEPNKDSASLGIHFRNAKVRILDETSYERDGSVSTWYKVRITEYGCSADANLGCGKNTPSDADEGWVNAKSILLD